MTQNCKNSLYAQLFYMVGALEGALVVWTQLALKR